MAAHFFPQGDGPLRTWMQNFLAKLIEIMAALGLPATFDDALIAAFALFDTSLTEQETAAAVAEQKTALKKSARTGLIDVLRDVVKALNADTRFTNAMRQLLGLPPRDEVQTPIDPGTEVPTFEVEIIGPQKHRIHFWQAGVTAGRRGKPAWAAGARILFAVVAVGAAPPALSAMQFLALDSATPYDWDIPAEHVGKMIYYRLAWETPTHELGPWSNPIGAIVSA